MLVCEKDTWKSATSYQVLFQQGQHHLYIATASIAPTLHTLSIGLGDIMIISWNRDIESHDNCIVDFQYRDTGTWHCRDYH